MGAVVSLLLSAAVLLSSTAGAKECTPNHLTPVEPLAPWQRPVADKQEELLLPPHRFYAAMITRPAFTGEYSVVLHGKDTDSALNPGNQFFLSCFAAEKNIFYTIFYHRGTTVPVTHTKREVSRAFAERIQDLWLKMLMRTRYYDDPGISLDGVDFEFIATTRHGNTLHGETRSDCTGPSLLIAMGHALINYCQAPEPEKATAMKEVDKVAADLEKYLKKHPTP